MSDLDWKAIQPGEVVAYVTTNRGFEYRLTTFEVERLTATQIVMTDGSKFRRDNGRRVGGDTWVSLVALDHPDVITAKVQTAYVTARRQIEQIIRQATVEGAHGKVCAQNAREAMAGIEGIAAIARKRIRTLEDQLWRAVECTCSHAAYVHDFDGGCQGDDGECPCEWWDE